MYPIILDIEFSNHAIPAFQLLMLCLKHLHVHSDLPFVSEVEFTSFRLHPISLIHFPLDLPLFHLLFRMFPSIFTF